MPVSVDELARIGSGQPATKPKAEKSVSKPQVNSNIQTVDDLASIGSGQEVKKKVGSEETTTDTSNGQSTIKLSDEAQSDLGITLGNNTQQPTSKVPATQIAFANIPKAQTAQQVLEEKGKNIMAKQSALLNSVDVFNNSFGTKFDPQKILSTSDDASNFLNLYKSKVAKADFDINSKLQPANFIASSESYGQPQRPITPTVIPDVEFLNKAKTNEKLLTDKVVSLSIDEKIAKGQTQEQAINDLHKRLDPKGFKRIQDAIIDRTGVPDPYVIPNSPLAKDIEPLKTETAPFELLYNEGLKNKADDYLTMGTLNNDKALIENGKSLSAQVQSDDQIYQKFPTLLKSKIANDFAKEIAEKTGQLQGSEADGLVNNINKFRGQSDLFNTNTFKKYYDNPETRSAVLDITANPENYVSDASFLGGIKTYAAKPFREIGAFFGDITGFRDKLDRLSEVKNEELYPEQTPELKGYVNKIRSAVNTTAYIGSAIALQTLGIGVGGAVGLGTKAATRLGTGTAWGMTSYDNFLKTADSFTDNPATKVGYAITGSILNTVAMEFLDLGKITKFPELQTPIAELSEKITDKNITKDAFNEILNKTKQPIINVIEKYGTNLVNGAGVSTAINFTNGINNMMWGGSATPKSITENVGSDFVSGLLSFSIIGAFGAHADLKNEKNTSWKSTIKTLGDNPDATRDVLDISLRNGQIDKGTYNEKVQILNTIVAAKNNLSIAEAGSNIQLDEGQKAVYVTNRTTEGIIKKQMESPLLTEQQKGTYEAQLKRLQTQREDVLKGLTFNDNLEPLDAIFKAQLEYKKAYEDFNEGVVENDSEVIKAKENLQKAIIDNGKSTEPIKPTTKVEPTVEALKNDMAGLSHADWFLKNKDKFSDEEFNRINTDLTSTDEAVKQKAVDEIIAKKDEVKSTPEISSETTKTEQTVTPVVTEPSTVKSEEVDTSLFKLTKKSEEEIKKVMDDAMQRVSRDEKGNLQAYIPSEDVFIKGEGENKEKLIQNVRDFLEQPKTVKPKSENKPIQKEQVNTESEIKNLEAERDAKIKEVSKPEISLNLLSRQELREIKGDSEFLDRSKDKHDEIKKKFESLKQVVECLWT